MHILQGMILRSIFLPVLAIMMVGISGAQGTQPGFPSQVLVARHTYFDFGPPFDFYEVLSLKDDGSSTSAQRILVMPAGNACIQPPTVEVKVATIGKSLPDVMQGKNPCDIPEKALRRERKRCKHCLNFSGVNVTLSVSCKKGDRQIRADILDRDLFDSSARTPPNTSWTMALLSQIDATLGPGVMDKPAFSVGAPGSDLPKPSDSVMLESLKVGKYDVLFDSDKKLSEIYRESLEPSRLPSVEILRMTPTAPVSADPPPYPPIARAAHVEGEVSISFEVSSFGKVEQLSFESGPEMLRRAVSDTSSKWQFPESSEVHHEEGTIAFRLNCPQPRPYEELVDHASISPKVTFPVKSPGEPGQPVTLPTTPYHGSDSRPLSVLNLRCHLMQGYAAAVYRAQQEDDRTETRLPCCEFDEGD